MMKLGFHDNKTLMMKTTNTTMTTNDTMALEKWRIEYCIRKFDV